MTSAGTIGSVVQPGCDAFAQYLMKLRKERGFSARALSLKLGLAESYLHKWEHDATRRVSREVLARIAELFSLPDPQRRELFHLADVRDVPEHARHLYNDPSRFLQNVDQAIRTVEHPPEAENLSPSEWQAFIESVAWTIANRAMREDHKGNWFTDRIVWPSIVYRHGIRTEHPEWIGDRPRIDVTHLVDHHFPVKPDAELTEDTITAVGAGMASIWCAWYCESIDRCLEAAKAIRTWSVKSTADAGAVATLVFQTTADNEAFGADGVACSAIIRAQSGALAQELYEDANVNPLDEMVRHYIHALKPIDSTVTNTYTVARWYLDRSAREPVGPRLLYGMDAALYLVCSDLWRNGLEPPLHANGALTLDGKFSLVRDRIAAALDLPDSVRLVEEAIPFFIGVFKGGPINPVTKATRSIFRTLGSKLRAEFESTIRTAIAVMHAANASASSPSREPPSSPRPDETRRSGAKKAVRKDRKKRRKSK